MEKRENKWSAGNYSVYSDDNGVEIVTKWNTVIISLPTFKKLLDTVVEVYDSGKLEARLFADEDSDY